MKIGFFASYLNHHQKPFCNELSKMKDVDFTFVSFKPMRAERVALGYEDMNDYSYVLKAYESDETYKKAEQLALECDVAVFGNAPIEFLMKRAERNKPTIVYAERMFKKGFYQAFSPRAIIRMKKTHSSFRNKRVYLFCAGAFTAADYTHFGAYRNKTYKWGYFPEVKRYESIEALIESKKKKSILWVGRMLDWKHPEYAIHLAKRLKKAGYDFTLNMIGTGPLEEGLKEKVKKQNLSSCVSFLGAMPPETVRQYMEESEIFLFTSDRQEGWGAVLNESMNSGCAVVASHIIGSVPFMLQHGTNGFIYKNKNQKDLYKKVAALLNSPNTVKQFGLSAYHSCVTEWNPENAALRFYRVAEALINNQDIHKLFENGVCSKAEILKDGWFHVNQ